MSDLIKREDAIEAMEQRYQDILRIFKRKVKVGEKAIALDMIGCIKSLPSADRPQAEWIPCSERLPKRQGYYICTCKDGSKYKKTTAVKWSNGWQLTGARAYWIVLAWMPLPKPWKGADDE